MEGQKKIALLIDADNVSYRHVPSIMHELVSKYGEVTIRRLYGNWSIVGDAWRPMIERYLMTPVFQSGNASGKNSSDIGLIIDAMDYLHAGAVDCFCIASSDSDYTSLVSRLREGGKDVIGVGEKSKVKESGNLARSCTRFLFIENLVGDLDEENRMGADDGRSSSEDESAEIAEITEVLIEIMLEGSDSRGYMLLSPLKNALINRRPDFDERTYGYSKFSKFVASLEGFVVPENDPTVAKLAEGERQYEKLTRFLQEYVGKAGSEGCLLSEVGLAVKRQFPTLSIKALGYSRLSSLVEDVPGMKLTRKGGGRDRVRYKPAARRGK